jgi:UDP:flavonoid glycosyltransferase YjiC (YdhE family)
MITIQSVQTWNTNTVKMLINVLLPINIVLKYDNEDQYKQLEDGFFQVEELKRKESSKKAV